MPLALLVLSTVPVRLSVRNTSCPLHISYTLHVGRYNGFALSRSSDGRSVRPSVHLHYRVRSIHPIQIEDFLQTWLQWVLSILPCPNYMLY